MTRGATHLLLYYFSLALLPTIAAQPGFISIDCGSSTNYTDDNGLEWSTDGSYISFGVNVNINFAQKQLSTARHFQRHRNKFCYSLPVTANSSYLLRASFLFGDLKPQVPPGYTFGLSIDSTVVGNVSVTESSVNKLMTLEFLTTSTIQQQQIAFCLLPVVGTPFISSLELRPLDPSMYGYMISSQYGVVQTRWNCGISTRDPVIRYKDDVHDRIWPPPDRLFNYPSVTADGDLQPNDLYYAVVPPPAVMQTAWETKSITDNITVSVPFDAGAKFYVGLYFQDMAANEADERVLDVVLDYDTSFYKNLTFSEGARFVYDYSDRIYQDHAVFTVKANPLSTLPPILNAFELHAIYPTVETTTGDSDVAALEVLKQSLHLTEWTGDPCLPVSWDWVNCTGSSRPEVTQLKLSGYQLHGTIPMVLATLSALTDLWLDDNFITGPLPDLSGLLQLKTLHVQNNSLSGPIPASLASIPNLQELFLESNDFNGSVPPELLNKIGLNLQVDDSVNSSAAAESHHTSKGFGATGALIGATVGAILVVALLAVVAIWCCVRNRRGKQKARSAAARRTDNSAGVQADQLQITKAFSLEELKRVTSNFAREIGRGGYGPVFYGKLDNGVEVAVKQNSITSRQGQAEFYTEVSLLSRVHHRNLVSLTGYCDEGDENVLIYEFMNGGTLSQRLYEKDMATAIDWQARISIALDAARGLEYLHYDCKPRIIHRDVKSSNILLNERLQAKVADFGFSKITNEGATTDFSTTKVVGTRGYLDPEYFVTNRLTYKSDVFAFGVVLLEIISGRPPFDESMSSLIVHVRQKLIESNLEAIVDPSFQGNYNQEAMWKLAELAMTCVEPASKNRPDMRDVVMELVEVKRYQGSNDPTAMTLRISDEMSDSGDQLEGPPATPSFTTDLHQDEDIRPWSPGSQDSIRNGPWQLIQPK